MLEPGRRFSESEASSNHIVVEAVLGENNLDHSSTTITAIFRNIFLNRVMCTEDLLYMKRIRSAGAKRDRFNKGECRNVIQSSGFFQRDGRMDHRVVH